MASQSRGSTHELGGLVCEAGYRPGAGTSDRRAGIRLERLEAERAAVGAVLDELAVGIAFLDRRGHVLHANRAFAELLPTADGLPPARAGLHAPGPCMPAALYACVGRALATDRPSCGTLVIERPLGRGSLYVFVTPVRAGAGARTIPTRALVLVTDPERWSACPSEMLRAEYGLTCAQTRVAERLATGASLESIAAELGIQLATVRNHLKQIFEKTGTHRQAELVASLHAAPPGRARRQ